jgi:hypothetical protein
MALRLKIQKWRTLQQQQLMMRMVRKMAMKAMRRRRMKELLQTRVHLLGPLSQRRNPLKPLQSLSVCRALTTQALQ